MVSYIETGEVGLRFDKHSEGKIEINNENDNAATISYISIPVL